MNDADFQVMVDAGDAVRAARLLRFLSRAHSHGEAASQSDRARLLWLAQQLLASRRGAQTVAMGDRLGPEPSVEDDGNPSFSTEQALYREYKRYSGAETPAAHAKWVDPVIRALAELHGGRAWQDFSQEEQLVVTNQLEPLLRRMVEATDRSDLTRGSHFYVV